MWSYYLTINYIRAKHHELSAAEELKAAAHRGEPDDGSRYYHHWLAALERLKPGGRWMELVYPRERWLREGALPFEEWGRLTDGDRTPWVEWYDIEKVRRRLFPAPLRTLLDFEFCSHNYRWFDLEYAADRPFST